MSKTRPEADVAWQQLFAPESVAIIGASNTPGSWGNNIMKGLLAGSKRKLFPVHPKDAEILGVKAYASIRDVPETVDLAVIVVSAPLVPGVLKDCVGKVKAVSIISAGFGETGPEGQVLEDEIKKIADEGGLRFIGPNSMGHANTGAQLSTFGQADKLTPGPVALVSQSGSTCVKIARGLNNIGVALSKYVSSGNEANIHLEDYLEYLSGDDDTKLVTAYIEGLREGRRFFALAKELTARKPMVVVKIGGTEESARAVMSHTGALAGADSVYTAAFKQSGVIRVEDDDELNDVVFSLLNCPLPRGNRIGILSIGGGPGALTAEACEKEGMAIGKIDPATITKLDECLPARWSGRNPVDMAGISAAEYPSIAAALWALMDDDNIDIILLQAPIVLDRHQLVNRMSLNEEQIKAYREKEAKNLMLIHDRVAESGKPVILMWQFSAIAADPDISGNFAKAKIPVYGNARRVARVLKHLVWYRSYLDGIKD